MSENNDPSRKEASPGYNTGVERFDRVDRMKDAFQAAQERQEPYPQQVQQAPASPGYDTGVERFDRLARMKDEYNAVAKIRQERREQEQKAHKEEPGGSRMVAKQALEPGLRPTGTTRDAGDRPEFQKQLAQEVAAEKAKQARYDALNKQALKNRQIKENQAQLNNDRGRG